MSQQFELVEIKKSIKRLESKIDQVLSIKNNDNDIIELKEYHHPHKIEYKDVKLDSNEKVKEWLLNQEYIFIESLEQLKPSYNIKNESLLSSEIRGFEEPGEKSRRAPKCESEQTYR
jgi:hypothetical protein